MHSYRNARRLCILVTYLLILAGTAWARPSSSDKSVIDGPLLAQAMPLPQRTKPDSEMALTPMQRFALALFKAVSNNDVAEVDRLIATRATSPRETIRHYKLIGGAIYEGANDVVRYILRIDPDALRILDSAYRLSLLQGAVDRWNPIERPTPPRNGEAPHARSKDYFPLIKMVLDAGEIKGLAEGAPLYMLATKPETEEVVRVAGWFLDAGASIERQSSRHPPALAAAVEKSNFRLLELFLERRKPSKDVLDEALVHCEVSQANKSIERLLVLGANINVDGAKYERRFTPAIAAARRVSQHGEYELMRLLIRYKVDPNRLDAPNESPLMLVVHEHDLMKGLLDLGANAKYRAANGDSAIHWAVRKPPPASGFREPKLYPLAQGNDPKVRERSVKMLLAAGADPSSLDSSGWTPLMRAAPEDEATIEALLERGGVVRPEVTLDGRLHSGMPAPSETEWAIARGNDPLAFGLLKRRPRPKEEDDELVRQAAQTGTVRAMALLFEQGARARQRDDAGWTALHHAASNGHSKAVALLIERGRAERNETLPTSAQQLAREMIKNPSLVLGALYVGGHTGSRSGGPVGGDTPLILASRSGHVEVVRELLRLGADARHRNEVGQSALQAAEDEGRREIVEMLRTTGSR